MFSNCNLVSFLQHHHIQYPKIRFGHSACPLPSPHRFKLFHFRKFQNRFLEMNKGASSVWYQDRRENWIVFHHDGDVGENRTSMGREGYTSDGILLWDR